MINPEDLMIAQAQEKKFHIECEIQALLKSFYEETGLVVEGIYVDAVRESHSGTPVHYEVNLDVEL